MKLSSSVLVRLFAAFALAGAGVGAGALAQVSGPISFSDQYDETKPVEVTGAVKRLDWGQPNVWIFLKVPDKDGVKTPLGYTTVGFSAGTTDAISRAGVNLTNLTAPITIYGYRARNECGVHPDLGPACKAIARTVRMPNGCTIFIGMSGIGAPKDKLDPMEGGMPASCTPG